MIEVNLHPSPDKKRGKGGGGLSGLDLQMPDFGDVRILETVRSDPWTAALVALGVVIPLVMGVLWFTQRSQEQELQARLDEALADSARLADLRALSDSLTEQRKKIQERIRLVRGLDQDRYVWPRLMDELSAALPNDAWLRSVTQQSPLPDMQVQVQGTAGTPLVITDYVRNLEASPYIGEIQIVGTNRQIEDGISTQQFTLSLQFDPRASGERRPQTMSLRSGGG